MEPQWGILLFTPESALLFCTEIATYVSAANRTAYDDCFKLSQT